MQPTNAFERIFQGKDTQNIQSHGGMDKNHVDLLLRIVQKPREKDGKMTKLKSCEGLHGALMIM